MPILRKFRIVEGLLVLKIHAMVGLGKVNGRMTGQGVHVRPHGVLGFVLVGEQEDPSAIGSDFLEGIEPEFLSDDGRILASAQSYKIRSRYFI